MIILTHKKTFCVLNSQRLKLLREYSSEKGMRVDTVIQCNN